MVSRGLESQSLDLCWLTSSCYPQYDRKLKILPTCCLTISVCPRSARDARRCAIVWQGKGQRVARDHVGKSDQVQGPTVTSRLPSVPVERWQTKKREKIEGTEMLNLRKLSG